MHRVGDAVHAADFIPVIGRDRHLADAIALLEEFQNDLRIEMPVAGEFFQGNGAQGADGSQGVRGFQGLTGAQGSAGSNGAQGAAGSNGAQGAAGSNGAQGAAGSAGAQGSAPLLEPKPTFIPGLYETESATLPSRTSR